MVSGKLQPKRRRLTNQGQRLDRGDIWERRFYPRIRLGKRGRSVDARKRSGRKGRDVD
jgi:hypothetical protein